MLVIDSSVAVWAVLPGLPTVAVNVIPRITAWQNQGARIVAPMLWLAECTSVIRFAVYRREISEAEGQVALADLFALEVEVLPITESMCRSALSWAGRLQQSRAYDALYLATAAELGYEFWSADRRLVNAAQQAGSSNAHWIGEA